MPHIPGVPSRGGKLADLALCTLPLHRSRDIGFLGIAGEIQCHRLTRDRLGCTVDGDRIYLVDLSGGRYHASRDLDVSPCCKHILLATVQPRDKVVPHIIKICLVYCRHKAYLGRADKVVGRVPCGYHTFGDGDVISRSQCILLTYHHAGQSGDISLEDLELRVAGLGLQILLHLFLGRVFRQIIH